MRRYALVCIVGTNTAAKEPIINLKTKMEIHVGYLPQNVKNVKCWQHSVYSMPVMSASRLYWMVHSVTSAGYDDDAVADELEVEDLEQNQLLEVWEDLDDFPFDSNNDAPKDDDAKRKFILDLIIKLTKNPNMHFGANIPNC